MKYMPFYDSKSSYEKNYDLGPFGTFRKKPSYRLPKKMKTTFFGYPVNIPFGIPSGPLLNSKFIKGAWNWGFSLTTYKTVRGNKFPCHPFPNVIRIKTKKGEIHPDETIKGDLNISKINVDKDGITNSFGVPSKPPKEWQADVKKALRSEKKGNLLILSFMGTMQKDMNRRGYIEDFVRTCKLAKRTGTKILEVNFSCPNFGKEGLICTDIKTSRDILAALKKAKGNTPLLVKIGYFAPKQQSELEKLLNAIYANADGVVAINTIPAKVVDSKGKQILPGSPVRLSSGICGATIRWAGLDLSKRIVEYKRKKNWKDFVAVGVGGITTPADYKKYMKTGVDAVQSATGAMWKPNLALQIHKSSM